MSAITGFILFQCTRYSKETHKKGSSTNLLLLTYSLIILERKEAQGLTETDICTECKWSKNPQVLHCSPVPILTLQDRRGVTGKGALLAECGAPGT